MKRLAMLAFALTVAVPALAQDASGKWAVTVTTQDGQNQAVLALKKDGETLSGTAARPQGDPIPVSGTQKGAEVVLSFSVPTQNGPLAVTMRGKQDGESMKGTIELGAEGRGDWTATRTAAPEATAPGAKAVDLTGTWALQVVTEAGTRTPTIVLKQDGQKLTGTYKSQLGESPITGEVKDDGFTFRTTLSFDGNSFTIVYTGTAEGAEMKGRVSVADMGSGTFTGKKQAAGD
jgi:hypothetical protein